MCMPMFGKGGGDGGAGYARTQQQQREIAINNGRGQIADVFDSQFTPDFFGGRRKAYTDYAKPQLDDQFADARKQLIFSLDRSGTLDSTGRTQKEAELQKEYDKNKLSIDNRALDMENRARGDVESARSDLMGMLSATGDQQGAVQAATGRAATLSAPQAFEPIGQLFGNFTNTLGTQAGLEKADALAGRGAGNPRIGRYNTGLFSHNNSVTNY